MPMFVFCQTRGPGVSLIVQMDSTYDNRFDLEFIKKTSSIDTANQTAAGTFTIHISVKSFYDVGVRFARLPDVSRNLALLPAYCFECKLAVDFVEYPI